MNITDPVAEFLFDFTLHCMSVGEHPRFSHGLILMVISGLERLSLLERSSSRRRRANSNSPVILALHLWEGIILRHCVTLVTLHYITLHCIPIHILCIHICIYLHAHAPKSFIIFLYHYIILYPLYKSSLMSRGKRSAWILWFR